MVHCEDGPRRRRDERGRDQPTLGIKGIPPKRKRSSSPAICCLHGYTGGWLHRLSRQHGPRRGDDPTGKERGVNVTAEVMPHHLVMTDEWVAG